MTLATPAAQARALRLRGPASGRRHRPLATARQIPGADRSRARKAFGHQAANAEEEALSIAVALREAAETQGKTAALVTPTALARRVTAALERWQVPVDDSSGDALADTSAGVFARLAAEVALGGLAPASLLAAQAPAYTARRPLPAPTSARSRRSRKPCCGARVRAPAASDWRKRSAVSAPSS